MVNNNYNLDQTVKNLEKLKFSVESVIKRPSEDEGDNAFNYQPDTSVLKEAKKTFYEIGQYFDALVNIPKQQHHLIEDNQGEAIVDEVEEIISSIENVDNSTFHTLVASKEYDYLIHAYDQFKEKNLLQDTEEKMDNIDLESNDIDQEVSFLNNLVEVKKDHHYELFYLRDEDNKKFYTDTLTQIIYKYGKLHGPLHSGDPFTHTILWKSEEYQALSNEILEKNHQLIQEFYKLGLWKEDQTEHINLHKAIMALLLSNNKKNYVVSNPKKSNIDYFNDFLYFLRFTLSNKDPKKEISDQYSKNIAYKLSKGVVSSYFNNSGKNDAVIKYVYSKMDSKFHEDGKKKYPNQYLMDLYDHLYRFFSKFPNGPLYKALDHLTNPKSKIFDPVLFGMIPVKEGVIKHPDLDYKIDVIRSSMPVQQESLVYASLYEEFVSFLDECVDKNQTTLIYNLQNRRSRLEKSRCRLLEEISEKALYAQNCILCTFPEPEELLKNLELEHGESTTIDEFIDVLGQEFKKDNKSSSFYISDLFRKAIVDEFIPCCLPKLKDIFFSKKKSFFYKDKLLLLYLVSYFCVFKHLESHKIEKLIILSKDGLDFASIFVAGLNGFNMDDFPKDEETLKLMMTKILAPTLMIRDRLIFSNSIDILCKFLSCIRKNHHNLKNLESLFGVDLEKWVLVDYIPKITT